MEQDMNIWMQLLMGSVLIDNGQIVYDSLGGSGEYVIEFFLKGFMQMVDSLMIAIGLFSIEPVFLKMDVYNNAGAVIEQHIGVNILGRSELAWINNLHIYMMLIAPCAMICILLTRIIQNMVDIGSGDSEYIPMSAIFTRAFKSCAMILVLPFLAQAILEIAAWFTAGTLQAAAGTTTNNIKTIFIDGIFTGGSLGTLFGTLVTFVCIFAFMIVYLFKLAKYQVDMLFMFLAIVPAGVSLCTDSNDFYNTWKSTFINLIVSQFYTIFIFALFCTSLQGFFGHPMSTIFGFGSLICMFKQPELIKRIGYSSSGAKHSSTAAFRLLTSVVARS